MGGERTKTNLQDMRGMSGEGGEGVGGMVREPESVEESLARNFREESSGRAGNWGNAKNCFCRGVVGKLMGG